MATANDASAPTSTPQYPGTPAEPDTHDDAGKGKGKSTAKGKSSKGNKPFVPNVTRIRRKTKINSPFFAREAAMLERQKEKKNGPSPASGSSATKSRPPVSSPAATDTGPASTALPTPKKISSPFLEAERETRRRQSVAASDDFEPVARGSHGHRRGSVFNRSTAEKKANRRMSEKAKAYMEAAKRAKEEEEVRKNSS